MEVERFFLREDSREQRIQADNCDSTHMELYVYLIPAIPVFLPEASSEVSNQFPDEREEGVIIGILGNLQVPIHQGAEVIGEELGEDVIGEELLQVQAILQKEADKLGSVLYESHKHDFLKVSRLRRKSRERMHSLNPIKKTRHLLSQTHRIFNHEVNKIYLFSCNTILDYSSNIEMGAAARWNL